MPDEWAANIPLETIMGHSTPETLKELANRRESQAGKSFWRLYLAWAVQEKGFIQDVGEIARRLTYIADKSQYKVFCTELEEYNESLGGTSPGLRRKPEECWEENYRTTLLRWFHDYHLADARGNLTEWGNAIGELKEKIHGGGKYQSQKESEKRAREYSDKITSKAAMDQFARKDPVVWATLLIDLYNYTMLDGIRDFDRELRETFVTTTDSTIQKYYADDLRESLDNLMGLGHSGAQQSRNTLEVSISEYQKVDDGDEEARRDAMARLIMGVVGFGSAVEVEIRDVEAVANTLVVCAQQYIFKQTTSEFKNVHVETAKNLAVAKGVMAVVAGGVSCAPPPIGPAIGLALNLTMMAIDKGIQTYMAYQDSNDYATVMKRASQTLVSKQEKQKQEQKARQNAPKVDMDEICKMVAQKYGVTPDDVQTALQSGTGDNVIKKFVKAAKKAETEEAVKKLREEYAEDDENFEKRLENFMTYFEAAHAIADTMHLSLDVIAECLEVFKELAEVGLKSSGYTLAGVGAIVGIGFAIYDYKTAGTKEFETFFETPQEQDSFNNKLADAYGSQDYAGSWDVSNILLRHRHGNGVWDVTFFTKDGKPFDGTFNLDGKGHFEPDNEQGYLETLAERAERNIVAYSNEGKKDYSLFHNQVAKVTTDWPSASVGGRTENGFQLDGLEMVITYADTQYELTHGGRYKFDEPLYLTVEGELKHYGSKYPKKTCLRPAMIDSVTTDTGTIDLKQLEDHFTDLARQQQAWDSYLGEAWETLVQTDD